MDQKFALMRQELEKAMEQELDQIREQMKYKLEQKLQHQMEQELQQQLEKQESVNEKMTEPIEEKQRTENQIGRGVHEKITCLTEDVHKSDVAFKAYFLQQPGEVSYQNFDRRFGTADMTGELFEVNVALFLFIKGIFETEDFYLATNMEKAGAFDDLVFKFTDKTTKFEHTCFLQLKHKMKKQIKRQALYDMSGDFSLLKYYASFCDIQREFSMPSDNFIFKDMSENCHFIIYTNTEMEEGDSCIEIPINNNPDNILNSGGSFGKVLSLVCGGEEQKTFSILKSYKTVLKAVASGNYTVDEIKSRLIEYSKLTQCKQLLEELKKGANFEKLLISQIADINQTSWENFLKKLRVYTHQATEDQLEAAMKLDLEMYCGVSGVKTRAIFSKLKEAMIDWWRKGNYFLSKSCAPFWYAIMEDHACSLVASMCTKMAVVSGLRFQDAEHFSLKGQVMHVVTQGVTILSCLKVHQNLSNVGHIVVDNNILQSHMSEVLALWGKGSRCNVLVVDGRIDTLDVVTEISNVLLLCPNKQVVLVTDNCDPVAIKLCEKFQGCTYTDNFTLHQLDQQSQTKILERKINFQGYIIDLKSLANSDTFQNILNADLVVHLLTDHTVEVGEKLADQEECYISRTLLRKEHVQKSVFHRLTRDQCLVITGISVGELKQLVPHFSVVMFDNSKNPSEYSEHRFFVISCAADFLQLSDFFPNTHWLHKQDDKFLWKKSKGNVAYIKSYLVQDDFVEYSDIEDIVQLPHQIVLVVAEPGMGKSTEMSHLVSQIKQSDPTMWVIKVDLNSYTDYLSQDSPSAVELLLKAAKLNSTFHKSLLENEMYKEGNIVVLFDGFDEISPNYEHAVFQIIKMLTTTKIKKIWVTSRIFMKEILEEELSSLSFEFKPFSENDQRDFLQKFWKMTDVGNFAINHFITKLLKLTERDLNDNLRAVTGIPLQTKMLAEAFQAEAKLYVEIGENKLPPKLNLLQLYDRFIDKKWEIYYEKNNVDMTNVGVSMDYQTLRNLFQQDHMNCALVSLLKSDEITKLHNSDNITFTAQKFLQKCMAGVDKTGIVIDVENNKGVFSHRTFAEYFVAKWFSENFEYRPNKNYLQENLLEPNFRIVRNFLDRFLSHNFDLHIAVLNQNITSIKAMLSDDNFDVNERDMGGRTALHLAVMNYIDPCGNNINNQIITCLLEHGADPGIEDKLFCLRPLRLADRIMAWAAVNLLLGKQGDSDNDDDMVLTAKNIDDEQFVQDVLSAATREGFVELIAFLLRCGIHVDHKILKEIHYDDDWIQYESTMLLEAAYHGQLKLVHFLVDHNADINVCTEKHKTPLMYATEQNEIQIVNFLLERGASVNKTDEDGCTALLLAAKKGEIEIVKLLVEYGSDLDDCDHIGNNILHCAVESRNFSLLMYLLGLALQKHINRCNFINQSPIWLSACYGQLEMTQLLYKRNADLNIRSTSALYNGFTPLHVAAYNGHLQVVQYLVQGGASLDALDKKGRTPLDVAIRRGRTDVVNFMQEASAIRCSSTGK